MRSLGGYLFVFLTIAFTVYGQLIMKTRVTRVGPVPAPLSEKLAFVGAMLLDPWVISCFAAAFLASICWMFALTRLPLSTAYPWMSMAFVAVLLLSTVFFGEALTLPKIVGMVLLVAGLTVMSQG